MQSDSLSALSVLDASGVDPFPILQNVWSFFSKKGVKTVFLSIGSSVSAAADLILSEQIGAPIHCIPLSASQAEQWSEVTEILKARKRDPATAKFAFTEGAEKRWVLPKNIRQVTSLPWWGKGALSLEEGAPPVATESVLSLVEGICKSMQFKEPTTRIDLLKVDCRSVAPGLERAVLGAILDAGFRPSVLLVNWSVLPDTDIATTSAAGHLQNTGYRLLSKIDTKFLYYFDDNDIYQTCSWEGVTAVNPIIQMVLSSVREQRPTAQKETSLSSIEERKSE